MNITPRVSKHFAIPLELAVELKELSYLTDKSETAIVIDAIRAELEKASKSREGG